MFLKENLDRKKKSNVSGINQGNKGGSLVEDFLVLPQGFGNFPSVFFFFCCNWIVGSSRNVLTDLIFILLPKLYKVHN